MVTWRPSPLFTILGVVGFVASLLAAAWFAKRKTFPLSWKLCLGLLMFLSIGSAIFGQTTRVVTELSSGGGDDSN
ncbi:MAG TPA: hypothetical protein VG944_13945 [Fimbriimonas sp.]|nr:hypothetical protein [Fimbriimonas sp.]